MLFVLSSETVRANNDNRVDVQTVEASSSSNSTTIVESWIPATSERAQVQDLHQEYNTIFRRGNRNAASHRWATFLLERSNQMTEERLTTFFEGFCAVSGSPVRPSDYNRYRLTLPKLRGGYSTGYMHYCCWPCVCDTQDFIRVDTRTVTLADGVSRTFEFAVIGNPCDHPEQLNVPFVQPFGRGETTIANDAREVHCLEDGTLEGATLSDHGYIIISMFFESEDSKQQEEGIVLGAQEPLDRPTPGRMSSVMTPDLSGRTQFQDEREYKFQCYNRAKNGYNSGMGEIFRKVSAISPIIEMALLPPLPSSGTSIKDEGEEKESTFREEQCAADDNRCPSDNPGSGNNVSDSEENLPLTQEEARPITVE